MLHLTNCYMRKFLLIVWSPGAKIYLMSLVVTCRDVLLAHECLAIVMLVLGSRVGFTFTFWVHVHDS